MPEPSSQKPEITIITMQDGIEVELMNYGARPKLVRVKPIGAA